MRFPVAAVKRLWSIWRVRLALGYCFIFTCTSFIFISCRGHRPIAELDSLVNEYLSTESALTADSLFTVITDANPDPLELYARLKKGITYTKADTGHHQLEILNRDGKERGFGYYIPSSYNPGKKHPLFLWLHGGVNGAHPQKGRTAYAPLLDTADHGFIVASVTGESKATWFDPAGITNIREAVRYIKRRYNIDDDRVYLGGVSDGGSGCYFAGNLYPSAFAGFIVWSGFPGILNHFRIPLHVENLKNRSWYIVHTGKDRLYPEEVVRQYIIHFQTGGVDVTGSFYREFNHDMGNFIDTERPKVYAWMKEKRRARSDTLDWSFDVIQFGRFDWIEAEEAGDPGNNYQFPARPIDKSKLTVVNPKSSRIMAVRSGNEIKVFLKYVTRFAVLIDPSLIDLTQKVAIYANGALVYNAKVRPDVAYMLKNARQTLDRERVYAAKVSVDLKEQ